MTDEEQIIFDKDVRKVRIIFIIIFAVLLSGALLFQKFTNDKYNQLKGEYKELNKDYIKQKDGVAVFQKNRIIEKDSLNNEIFKREKQNVFLSNDNKKLQDRINSIQNRKQKVEPIDGSKPLGEQKAKEITIALEEGDKCLEIIPLKNQQLANQEKQITNLEKDKNDLKTELSTAEQEIIKRQLLQESGDRNIENLQSQVKTLNRKNNLNKVLIPAAVLLGGAVGYKLAK